MRSTASTASRISGRRRCETRPPMTTAIATPAMKAAMAARGTPRFPRFAAAEPDAEQHHVAALVGREDVEEPLEADRIHATGDERQRDRHGQLGTPLPGCEALEADRRVTVPAALDAFTDQHGDGQRTPFGGARPPRTDGGPRRYTRRWESRASSGGSSDWWKARSAKPSAAASSRSRSPASCSATWTTPRSLGVRGTVAPNYFVVCLCEEDAQRFDDYADVLERELAEEAREHARTEGYHFIGPVTVSWSRTPASSGATSRWRPPIKEGPRRPGRGARPARRHAGSCLGGGHVRHRAPRRLRSPSRTPRLPAPRRDPPRAGRLSPRRPRVAERRRWSTRCRSRSTCWWTVT